MNKRDPVTQTEKWLVLIPTRFEQRQIVEFFSARCSVPVEICGFGPVVPAARTVQLIQQYSPDRVLLMGIAGRYDHRLEIGSACSFSSVACYGVGVGSLDAFQTAGEMGWPHWCDPDGLTGIGDVLSISTQERSPEHQSAGPSEMQLLTVCSAAANEDEVQSRKKHFPGAMAEDMEAFSVAAACQLCNIPVVVVRGISNHAGDRIKANWKIRESLKSAADLAERIMGDES